MDSDAWLAGIVGVAGIVLVALVVVALRAVNGARRIQPGASSDDRPPTSAAYAARGLGHVFGGMNTSRRRRSVEGNLQRAFLRIDSVDPQAGPRRIGMALAEVGLLSPVPEPGDDMPSEPTWPTNRTGPDRSRREDDE